MSPRKSRRSGRGSLGLYLVIAILAGAAGFLGAYLLQEHRSGHESRSAPDRRAEPERTAPSDVRAPLEALLGPLDESGTRADVERKTAAQELLAKIQRIARKHPDRVEVTEPKWARDRVTAVVRVSPDEYPLEIRWPAEAAESAQPPTVERDGEPRLALVIDDFGGDLRSARAFLDLEANITPAIIPGLAKSVETAHLVRERGRPFLIHLPMEPQGYPKANPGKGALLQAMHEEEIRRRVNEALAALPGAAGLNNHMGSKLTELQRPMNCVMEELRRSNLFFVDSMTSPKSVAWAAARHAGIGWQKRDVFLDNDEDAAAIRRQLDLALEKAKRNGTAIAIGHPYATTLETIGEWVPRAREEGVRLVPVTELVRRPEG
ncbi:MAG: divergent polysaccharide deacetylase family protein [Deltaproteobacteria bacterium]|nr:divergent polysaccharide deacetylase family protein [Deltaproteobacteria bacterium]